MTTIGRKISKWVDSQKEIAEEIGMSPSSINSMLKGKMRLPLSRFLQIAYYLNPPKEEVAEVFNLYLEELELPPDAFTLVHKDTVGAGTGEISLSSANTKLHKIMDAVMDSDLNDEAKVKVYKIIQQFKGK